MSAAPVLLVVGTASSVGKSVLVTALCRIFAQHGVRVAPFKGQNMSNNADVTPDGLEIGRAQSEQAAAAGLAPSVDMNPVLLKPQADRVSQLVLDGRPAGVLRSSEFLERKRDLWPHVERALERLRTRFDLVVAEGAGSPAEPNLRAADIVNMRLARHANATTLLVGDIDRGGLFAHLLGTLELLSPEDRALVRGLVINRFRGDPSLLAPAIEEIERRTGVPVLGVIPWIDDLGIAEEDAVALERPATRADAPARAADVEVAAIRLPRIANFDDLDPLAREPGVRVRWVERPQELGAPRLIVLPGTKSTIADLEWLRRRGLDAAIAAAVEGGAQLLGICGGYQMLGRWLTDEPGVEASPGTRVPGLALLPVETTFAPEKSTRQTAATVTARLGPWAAASGLAANGYEIHMGRTEPSHPGLIEPFLQLDGRDEGSVSADGRVAGCYLHGLLHNDALRAALLSALGRSAAPLAPSDSERREAAFDSLAAVVRAHLDLDRVTSMLQR
jgi:adenosylcobyric acid synthase